MLYSCAQYNHEADETGEGEEEEAHNLVLALYVRDTEMTDKGRVDKLVTKMKEMVPSFNFETHRHKLDLHKSCPKGDLQENEEMMTYSAAYEKYSGKQNDAAVDDPDADAESEAEAAAEDL